MKKNTMIKILSLLAVVLSMTACSNTEAPDSSSITTTVTTTTVNTTTAPVVTPSEISSTSLSESVPVVSDETTITTTVQEVETSTSTEKIDGSTSIETTSTSATTTKKPATVTTTTTKKATTTTKKTTTTAKTTTKKTTTTAKTTTKVTTTTVQKANLTQANINKLVKELQEYSNSKAEYVTSNWTKYRGYGTDYTTLEEFYAWLCEDKTPSNSSWSAPSSFDIYDDFYTYEYMLSYLKEAIDNEYEDMPNCHVVVYAEYFPNGFIWEGVQYTSYPCYTFFELR